MVKINLRKAASAVQVLNTEIANLRNEVARASNTQISIFDEIETKISTEQLGFDDKILRMVDLTNILYDIRSKVAQANATNGVNEILARIAYDDSLLGSLSLVAKAVPADLAILKKRADATRSKMDTDTYGVNENLAVSLVSKDAVERATSKIVSLKRDKREAQDKLLAINVNSEIELTEFAETVLKELAVI